MIGKIHPRRLKKLLAANLDEAGEQRAPIDVSHNRLIAVSGAFAVAFTIILLRLTAVTLLSDATKPHLLQRIEAYQPKRADIVDRNGVVLATSLETDAVTADPRKIDNPAEVAAALKTALPGLDLAATLKRLQSTHNLVYLAHNLSPREVMAVNELGLAGVGFEAEERRVYPQETAFAHLIGYAGEDNHGLAGIEQHFDARLRAAADPLPLSLDVRVQSLVHDELAAAIEKFHAIGGAGLVMDARTAELYALVSLPDFDPNRQEATPLKIGGKSGSPRDTDPHFNRASLGVYELGSTFKMFTVAMALDAGTTTLTGGYDATDPIHIARFTISDYHAKHRFLTTPEIFMYSSNIGAAKMALDVGPTGQKNFLGRVGMLHAAPLEIPEIGRPHTPNPWRPINVMTIAFGHGISVSPVQLISGAGAVVNGGIYLPATLLKQDASTARVGTAALSLKTSEAMRSLLRLVVEGGTGKEAEVPGYLVGGKTGTAEKIAGHRSYQQKSLISSFIGAFPINDPRFLVFIMLDEPQGIKETYGYATGGWVAAPSVRRIIERIGPLLAIPKVDDSDPEIRKKLQIPSVNLPLRIAAVKVPPVNGGSGASTE